MSIFVSDIYVSLELLTFFLVQLSDFMINYRHFKSQPNNNLSKFYYNLFFCLLILRVTNNWRNKWVVCYDVFQNEFLFCFGKSVFTEKIVGIKNGPVSNILEQTSFFFFFERRTNFVLKKYFGPCKSMSEFWAGLQLINPCRKA